MASRKGNGSPPADKPPRKQAKKVRAKALPQPAGDLTVVGIGASAGGLQAMQAFFDALAPDTGMAFVVVTHLHPEHESHLAELLQIHTKMPVNQVEGQVSLEANHVYVVPPNRRILMTNSDLDVTGFEEPRGNRTPVDDFFRSLAHVQNNAVAIVFSGGRTDSLVGMKDIEEDGGIPMVQNPDKAEQVQPDLNDSLEQRVLDRTQELNQLNLKLAKTRDLFFTLFHSSPIPTALTRLEDGVIINANDAYLRYFDLARDEVIGHSTQELDERLSPVRGEEQYAQLQRDGGLRDIETTIKLPSGEVRTSLVSIQYVDMEGTPASITAFIDITDRIRAERQVRGLATSLISAEQEERRGISQILHDDLQQRLFAIRMHLSFLREACQSQQAEGLPADLPKLESWLSEAIEVTRQLSIDLGPRILPDEGLADAVQGLAAQMEQQFGLEVSIRGTAPLLHDETLRILLFQAVREALFNVVKHAGTLHATVTFQQAHDRLHILVSDQGKGLDPQELMAEPGASHGLSSVRKRLTLLGCSLETNSSRHGGTQVVIDAPSGDAGSPNQS